MAANYLQGGLNLLGQASTPLVSPKLPGQLEPQLEVPWGAFRQGVGSSVLALFARAGVSKDARKSGFFKDAWIERRIPRRALVAAALWHVVFVAVPFPGLTVTPRRNPALDNFQLTWSGPAEDFPVIEIPKQKAKPAPRAVADKPEKQPGADAFHPRQRIFTDPVRPTHLRQTLINPAAPFEPPKMLPQLPNIVQLQQVAAPARPKLLISEETLKKLRPREPKIKSVTAAPPLDAPNIEQRVAADMSLATLQDGPSRPKLEINAGAAPRVAQRAQNGDAGPAPEVAAAQVSAAGNASTFIALSATPAPPAQVQPPPGNLAARVAISPEGPKPGGPAVAGGAGNSPVGISISGGNPMPESNVSGLGAARLSGPSVRALITRPDPKVEVDDTPIRTGPPDFRSLPPGAKPEQIFVSKRVYTLHVNMPNLNSATGSWILNFSELRTADGPHIASGDLAGPVPLKKIDPKYPPSLISERVEGEVVLYAVIGRDGVVSGIQLVHGIDEQLDANAMDALGQWKFRPGAKEGTPVELEAIVHIPFRVPEQE